MPKQKTKRINKHYEEIVENSSQTRLIIDGDWKQMQKIGEQFEKFLNIDKKIFMLMHRANYYGLEKKYDDFVKTIKYLSAIGKLDTLNNEFFRDAGIEIRILEPVEIEMYHYSGDRQKKELKKVLQMNSIPENPIELANILLDDAHGIQREICQLADSIKIDAAARVKVSWGIEKPHFVNAVRIKTDQKKIKDRTKKVLNTTKKVVKARKTMRSIEDSISIF